MGVSLVSFFFFCGWFKVCLVFLLLLCSFGAVSLLVRLCFVVGVSFVVVVVVCVCVSFVGGSLVALVGVSVFCLFVFVCVGVHKFDFLSYVCG